MNKRVPHGSHAFGKQVRENVNTDFFTITAQ